MVFYGISVFLGYCALTLQELFLLKRSLAKSTAVNQSVDQPLKACITRPVQNKNKICSIP